MRLVFLGEKRTLMMVEPPCQARIRGVLEVDDCVLIAIEKAVIEMLRRGGGHAREVELGARMKSALHETRKKRSRGRAVEAMVVMQDSYLHVRRTHRWENLLVCFK